MPMPEQAFAIAVFKNKIYCIGGLPYGNTGLNQVYDPATDSWETKTAMPTARYGLQANVIDGKIYLMGGVEERGYNQGVQLLNITEVYDPSTDSWTTKSPMPNPEGYVSAVVNNKIYIIGAGLTQIYDPETDSWSNGAPSPINITAGGDNGIAAAAAATTGVMGSKRIYVYDGSYLQVYDPKNDSWSFGTNPPTNRQYLGIAVVNDLLYFIGGFIYTPYFYYFYDTNELYTPFGYGTPDPSPTPTPSLSSEPSIEPPEPTQTASPSIEPKNNTCYLPIELGIIIVIIAVVAGALIYFKRRGGKRE
jgi:hypothetical protein